MLHVCMHASMQVAPTARRCHRSAWPTPPGCGTARRARDEWVGCMPRLVMIRALVDLSCSQIFKGVYVSSEMRSQGHELYDFYYKVFIFPPFAIMQSINLHTMIISLTTHMSAISHRSRQHYFIFSRLGSTHVQCPQRHRAG